MNSSDKVRVTAIGALAALEVTALITGNDGMFFAGTLALIGSIVGARWAK